MSRLLLKDFTILFLVGMQFFGFGYGLKRLLVQLVKERTPLDTLECASVGAIALVGIMAIVGMFGIPTIWLGAVLAGALQAFGFFELYRRRSEVRAFMRRQWVPALILGAFAVTMICYWLYVMRELPGLPTHHDGVAHTGFFLRMLDGGSALLHFVPLAFSQEFGASFFQFYPSGSHAFVAAMNGWMIKAGIATAAPVLKGWMLLACVGSGPLAWWWARKLFPEMNEAVYLVCGLTAATFFQYPVWGTDSGGFSRVFSHFLVLPFILLSLRTMMDFWERWPRTLLLVLVFPGAFLLHPSNFGLMAFSLGLAFLARLWQLRSSFSSLCREVLWLALPSVGGIILTFAIMRSGQSLDVIDMGDISYRDVEFIWANVLDRWNDLWTGLTRDYREPSHLPLSTHELIRWAGWITLLTPVVGRRVNPSVRWYPAWMVILGLLILLCVFSPNRFVLLIGELFYNRSGRLLEVFYAYHMTLWAFGVVGIYSGWKWLMIRLPEKVASRTARIVVDVAVIAVLVDFGSFAKFNTRHLDKYFAHYQSPMRRDSEEVARFVRNKTEKDAALLYRPYSLDSLEGRTGRAGFFIYLECPTGMYSTANCDARTQFYHSAESNLFDKIKAPTPDQPCLEDLSKLNRPVYWMLDQSVLPVDVSELSMPYNVCSNVRLEAIANSYAIFAYKNQL